MEEVSGAFPDVPEETDDARRWCATNGFNLDDQSDDQGREHERHEVAPQPQRRAHPRDHQPSKAEPDGLVDLIAHRSQAQRAGVEPTIAEQVGHQDLTGCYGRPTDELDEEKQREEPPQDRRRRATRRCRCSLSAHRQDQATHQAGSEQVGNDQDVLVGNAVSDRREEAAPEDAWQQTDREGCGGCQRGTGRLEHENRDCHPRQVVTPSRQSCCQEDRHIGATAEDVGVGGHG